MIRKQNESNRNIKQDERRQKRQNINDEDIDIGKFFEVATTERIYVNNLNLHEIKNELSLDYNMILS